jgi:hypothetical protein
VAEFVVAAPSPAHSLVVRHLSTALGCQGILRVEMDKGIGRLILNKRGKIALERVAKKAGLTKGQFIKQLVTGESG